MARPPERRKCSPPSCVFTTTPSSSDKAPPDARWITPTCLCRAARFSASPCAEAILPDEHSRYPNGVSPDLPVALSVPVKRQIFQQSLTKGMAPFVFETDRPHLNEAALLAGTNPEIEAAQAAQQRRAQGGRSPRRYMMRFCSAGSISSPQSKSTKSKPARRPDNHARAPSRRTRLVINFRIRTSSPRRSLIRASRMKTAAAIRQPAPRVPGRRGPAARHHRASRSRVTAKPEKAA